MKPSGKGKECEPDVRGVIGVVMAHEPGSSSGEFDRGPFSQHVSV